MKKELIVSCFALFPPCMVLDKPPFRTWTDTQFLYSYGQDKDTLDAPRHFEGREEH